MFQILNGRSEFWQWDLDQKLIVQVPECSEVHFDNRMCDKAPVVEVYEQEGQRLVNVPNLLLQDAGIVTVYAYIKGSDGSYTKVSKNFGIKPRCKPSDYVYTETEVKSYEKLDQRIKALEGTAILTTPQELTDEQRAQARANIAKVQYDWREVTCPFSGTQRLADYQATFGSSSFDIDKAIALPSAVLSTHSAIGCLHTSVDMLCNTVNLDEKTVLNSMGGIVTDYELMKSEGVLTSSNRLYVCRKNQYTDEVYEYYLLQPISNGYTHHLSFTCYEPYRATVIFYNKDTGAYKVTRSANNYTDSTLTLEYSPADAKATGDAIAAAKTTAETAQTTAESAQSTAESAQSTAETALSGLVGKITAPQTAEVGQTIVVKSVDDDGAPKEWGAYTIPQADFLQNDETAADYMKNRTHWTEREKVILSETSLTQDGDEYATYLEDSIGLVAGNSYTVVYAGEKYTCNGVDLTSSIGTVCVGLGNLAEFGIESAEYPFIVLDAPGGIEDGFCTAVMGSGEATVSIVYEGETVHKLDNKYLNLDWLPVSKKAEIIPETTVESSGYLPCLIGEYDSITVLCDGVEYNCSVTYETTEESGEDLDAYVAVVGTVGYLRQAVGSTNTLCTCLDGNSHIISVYADKPDPLPEDFLPDSVGKVKTVNGIAPDEDGNVEIELEGSSGDYIPIPQTAEVGQVVSVKAVDDEGKPTEWELVKTLRNTYGEEVVFLEENVTIPSDSPVLELSFDLPEEAMNCNTFILFTSRSIATNDYDDKGSLRFMPVLLGSHMCYYTATESSPKNMPTYHVIVTDFTRKFTFRRSGYSTPEANWGTAEFQIARPFITGKNKNYLSLRLIYYTEYAGDIQVKLYGYK